MSVLFSDLDNTMIFLIIGKSVIKRLLLNIWMEENRVL